MAIFPTGKVDGVSTYSASECNQQADLNNAISSTGQTPSTGDLNQIAKSMAQYGSGNFYTDSGVANAYILSTIGTMQSPDDYFDGMEIRFRAANASTGASTVNVAGLGVVNIKKEDGATDPDINDISTTEDTIAVYDGTAFRLIGKKSYLLGSVQTFTTSGTWTKPTGCRAILVEVQGGGGPGANAPASRGVAGGGAGGYAKKFITTGLGATETITIGIGGLASIASAGGTSSFGSHVTATGGSAGNNAAGGDGGVGSSGDIIVTGNPGQSTDTSTTNITAGGNGGSGMFGGAGRGQLSSGQNGQKGSGGSGGHNSTNGGDGGDGFIVVYEYY